MRAAAPAHHHFFPSARQLRSTNKRVCIYKSLGYTTFFPVFSCLPFLTFVIACFRTKISLYLKYCRVASWAGRLELLDALHFVFCQQSFITPNNNTVSLLYLPYLGFVTISGLVEKVHLLSQFEYCLKRAAPEYFEIQISSSYPCLLAPLFLNDAWINPKSFQLR